MMVVSFAQVPQVVLHAVVQVQIITSAMDAHQVSSFPTINVFLAPLIALNAIYMVAKFTRKLQGYYP